MSYKGLPENLVARINSAEARAYAVGAGWTRVPMVNGTVAVYVHPKSDLDQLLIPLEATATDYARRMAEVVVNLAEDERRPASEVLNDLLMPPSDVLRFRLEEPETEVGSVPLMQAIDVLEGARKALLASACSVVQPQTFHPRLSRTEADQLLQACQLGQTERGSFTAVIACPLDAVGSSAIPSLPLFEQLPESGLGSGEGDGPSAASREPFTRKATGLLMRSAGRIVSAVNADRVDALLTESGGEPPLSANLCDALMMMRTRGDRSRLTLQATWSRTLPPRPSSNLPTMVHLRRDEFRVIERLSEALRPTPDPKPAEFVGLVDVLAGKPDDANQVSGEVQLLVFSEDGNFRARVNLPAREYQVALHAHGVGGFVSLKGILRRGDRIHRIDKVADFRPPSPIKIITIYKNINIQ